MTREEATEQIENVLKITFPNMSYRCFNESRCLIENEFFKILISFTPFVKDGYNNLYFIVNKLNGDVCDFSFKSFKDGSERILSRLGTITKNDLIEIYNYLDEKLKNEYYVLINDDNPLLINGIYHKRFINCSISNGNFYNIKEYCNKEI